MSQSSYRVYVDANKVYTDLISLLPEEVLGHILSLVPTKLAASTSILSKKWRNVFALVHNLDFDDTVLLQPEEGKEKLDSTRECFKNFVDSTLALQRASPIKKFSLKCHIHKGWEMGYVNPWIYNAVDRGVSELDIRIKTRYKSYRPGDRVIGPNDTGHIYLRSELLTCKTLVKLTLGTRITLGKLPLDVSLPALKCLFIDSIFMIGEDLCKVLLPGCPVLEELFVHHEDYYAVPWCICSKTIKKLSVYYDAESEIELMECMLFDAPNLVSLDYSDYALYEYPHVNLGSLVEAKLDIHYSKQEIKRPDLTGLIVGISNVQTLHLTPASTDVIARCVKHGLVLPVFNNLVTLSFGSENKRGWKLLPSLLELSPKLETLIIQGLDCYTSDMTMSPLQVRVLHVLGYKRSAKMLEDLKRFLRHSKCLEMLQVEFAEGVVVDEVILAQTFRDLGTSASSECKYNVTIFF